MGSHQEEVDTYNDSTLLLYLGSLICSFAISIWIRYYSKKHKTDACKKFDVWKIFGNVSPNRSMFAVTGPYLIAFTAAIAGGVLSRAGDGPFSRALFCALPAGGICALLTGSPILFATTALFIFTGIFQSPTCYDSMGLATESSAVDACLNNLNNTGTVGAFDWFLGTPTPSWTAQTRWSHDVINLSLHGLMWTIPLGLPIRSYRYSSLVTFSGFGMGLAYHAGYSVLPFPLCLLTGWAPGMDTGNFYMGAWLFFVLAVCLLGSNHPLPSAAVSECKGEAEGKKGGDTTANTCPPMEETKPGCTIVDLRAQESESAKQWGGVPTRIRAVDTDTDTDEEPLVMATVIGYPVSSVSTPTPSSTSISPNTTARKHGRCGRPLHGTRSMRCCWATHFFLSLYLICVAVFVLCMWWDYSPEVMAKDTTDSAQSDEDGGWFFGWDAWYMWLLIFFLLTYTYRVRHRRAGRVCCCRHGFSG